MEQANISLEAMLAAREHRAAYQRELLSRFGKTLICFTMNIPGPEKNNTLITGGFRLGCRMITDQLNTERIPILYREERTPPTGCEGYYVADAPAHRIKALMTALENSRPVARLFDLDVLTPDGVHLDRESLGLSPRKCLLCQESAKVCGRARAHGLPALRERTRELLSRALEQEHIRFCASMAAKALLFEVCATPKPGLVDRSNTGSHGDMDIFTFMSSAAALFPYFEDCAAAGVEQSSPEEAFRRLRLLGREAEGQMYRATGGVNTHKGAIFTLGLLCGAAGQLIGSALTPQALAARCAAMVGPITSRELEPVTPDTAVTHGQKLYAQYGITGIRGQVEAGFPAVLQAGLPTLRKALEAGHSLEEAGCAALLSILASCDDTNLIARGGLEAQREIAARLNTLLSRQPCPDRETLEALDREFIGRNLSPGGSADLLAATYFLHFITESPAETQRTRRGDH